MGSSRGVPQARGSREPPAFGPGHSQPLPSPAWEGLRAFLQPLVGPPRLPTLLAVDLLSSLGHSCCFSLPPPHPPAEVGPGKQGHCRPAASQDFAGYTTVPFWSRGSLAAACRPLRCTSSTGCRIAHHLSHRVPTSHPEWGIAPPIWQVMKHKERGSQRSLIQGVAGKDYKPSPSDAVPGCSCALHLALQAATPPALSLSWSPSAMHLLGQWMKRQVQCVFCRL